MTGAKSASLLRDHSSAVRVTNIALFFDLVYIFAATQLSHGLLEHLTWSGACQMLLLLLACLLGYYVAAHVFVDASADPGIVASWIGTALVGGPLFGVAGYWASWEEWNEKSE